MVMDRKPGNHPPLLSDVMSRISSFGPTQTTTTASVSDSDSSRIDIEQPHPHPFSEIAGQMPQFTDPKLMASMTRAISDVSQARSVLQHIGQRPNHEDVDIAKAKLADVEAHLSRQLEEIVLSPRPPEIDIHQWQAHLADKEKHCRESAENEERVLKSLIRMDEMHDSYEKLLKDAEKRLVKVYESAEEGAEDDNDKNKDKDNENDKPVGDEIEVNEEVAGILKEAYGKSVVRVDLSKQRLRLLPEPFGHIHGLVVLDVSSNQLSVIPDSIAGLQNLEELNISSNLLASLPDSIGLLQKLKFLNVSGNKLNALPDSVSQCRSLVELDASLNCLTYLPTKIGYELLNLQKLSIQLNKIRSLPSSVCEMKSLRYLDAHFNELHGLPIAIGRLTNLEVLNLSSNFSDLEELPETFGDLTSLRELDLSNNQIHALPDTFGRLDKLTKLNLEQNPLELPPMEIANQGVEAIKTFMAKRWIDIVVEEERKRTRVSELQEEGQGGWLTRSTSWLKNASANVTEYLGTAVRSPKSPASPTDAYLDQQL